MLKLKMMKIEFWRQKLICLLKRGLLRLKAPKWSLTIMVTIYSVVFSYYTIMRHYSFRSDAWDLGIIVQSIASATRGKLFINNAELYYSSTGSYFGVHFAPILLLMVPFFYLVQRVETILVLQSVVLAMGAIPVYLIADYILGDENSALFISASYLLNPLLQGINWYDFHTQAFFPLFMLLATYFLKRKRSLLYVSFLILTLSTIEQAAYFVMAYAPYCLWEMREKGGEGEGKSRLRWFLRRFMMPLATFTIAIAWIILSSRIKYVINPNPPPEIKAAHNFEFLDISDPVEIPGKIISNPDLALKSVQFEIPKKIFYIILTFAPSCFLAFLSPIALLPVFLWLFLATLSNWGPYYLLGFQYTSFTLPFVSIAMIEALRALSRGFNEALAKKIVRRISTAILLVGIIFSVFLSPLSFIHEVGSHEYFRDYGVSTPSIMDDQVRRIIAEIPGESIILTTRNIFPHLSVNLNAYTIPPIGQPSQRLFRSFIEYLKNNVKFDYVLITYFWNKMEAELIYTELIKSSGNYGLFIKGPGLEVYRRGYNEPPERASIKFTCRELYVSNSVIADDPTSEAGKVIVLKASSISGRTAWYGPYITLLPGNYTVRFKIKVDSVQKGRIIELDVYSMNLGKIASHNIYSENMSKPFTWYTFSISFSIKERVKNVEFRGMDAGSNISIYLDYVEVIPE